jgi:hypothetical protein
VSWNGCRYFGTTPSIGRAFEGVTDIVGASSGKDRRSKVAAPSWNPLFARSAGDGWRSGNLGWRVKVPSLLSHPEKYQRILTVEIVRHFPSLLGEYRGTGHFPRYQGARRRARSMSSFTGHTRSPRAVSERGARAAAVCREGAEGVPDLRRAGSRIRETQVRWLRQRKASGIFVQGSRFLSQLHGQADVGHSRPAGGRCVSR